jgi:hypothetical protein
MVSNEKWFGASAGFYPETIGQSLRFDRASNSYLRRTGISSAGNQDKITISAWLKLSNTVYANVYNIFSQGSDNNNRSVFYIWRHKLRYAQVVSGTDYIVVATADLRDYTNFLHVALTVDMTQSSNSDKVHFYINGKREAISSGSYLSTNTDMYFNGTTNATIGGNSTGTSTYDGYMAELNVLDGVVVGATQVGSDYILDEFGEQKNGVWIPKPYSGSYGTTGFRLTFANSSSIGEDSAGSNDFGTVNNINDYDIVLDSPTNNFSTFNSLEPSSVTLSEGNLLATVSSGFKLQRSTFFVSSGKWYWEILAKDGGNGYIGASTFDEAIVSRGAETNLSAMLVTSDGDIRKNASESSYGNSVSDGDIIGVALDMDNGKIYFSENGTYYNSGNPASSTNPATTGLTSPLSPSVSLYDNEDYIANFGQDSSFAGNKTAQGNTDGNGKGDFYYAPPSGFLALCSSNLPDTTLSPNQSEQADDYFNTVLYTGNGSTQSITGVGFQPDWVWVKNRGDTNWHNLYDSTRGVTEALASNSTNAEQTRSTGLSAFGTDGFTSGADNNSNKLNNNYASWNWKAGGTAPTKTYKVVVVSDSGNKYRFRNSADSTTFAQSAVTLDLQEGGTYVFDWSDSTAQGHPIRFSTTSDGTHGGGSEYTTGVVKDDSAYKTTITVASSAPTLYYYCQNHSGMGGQVNTNTTHGSTNFDGSILSVSQTNETAGFSIITYTGTGVAGTIGHGLGKTPALLLTKNRSWSHEYSAWLLWHHERSNAFNASTNFAYLHLTTTGGTSTTSFYRGDQINTTTYGIYTNDAINDASYNYVCYAFAEVEGYSKFGTYTGNGSTDGTFVFTGFRPAWVLTKTTSVSSGWRINDAVRNPFNGVDANLYPSASNAEDTGTVRMDFVSNGFKLKVSGGSHPNASTSYIYMAFAEQPFKFSNAR